MEALESDYFLAWTSFLASLSEFLSVRRIHKVYVSPFALSFVYFLKLLEQPPFVSKTHVSVALNCTLLSIVEIFRQLNGCDLTFTVSQRIHSYFTSTQG